MKAMGLYTADQYLRHLDYLNRPVEWPARWWGNRIGQTPRPETATQGSVTGSPDGYSATLVAGDDPTLGNRYGAGEGLPVPLRPVYEAPESPNVDEQLEAREFVAGFVLFWRSRWLPEDLCKPPTWSTSRAGYEALPGALFGRGITTRQLRARIAFRGADQTHLVNCPVCDGNGFDDGDHDYPCHHCGTCGEVERGCSPVEPVKGPAWSKEITCLRLDAREALDLENKIANGFLPSQGFDLRTKGGQLDLVGYLLRERETSPDWLADCIDDVTVMAGWSADFPGEQDLVLRVTFRRLDGYDPNRHDYDGCFPPDGEAWIDWGTPEQAAVTLRTELARRDEATWDFMVGDSAKVMPGGVYKSWSLAELRTQLIPWRTRAAARAGITVYGFAAGPFLERAWLLHARGQ